MVLGCLGLATNGCAFQLEAVSRASREFSCPVSRIAVVQRADIAADVYDLNACGTRVRYACVWGQNVPTQCVREPDPPKWDLDPALVAGLPRPVGVRPDIGTPAVCDASALSRCDDCLQAEAAGWRWHHCTLPGPMGAP